MSGSNRLTLLAVVFALAVIMVCTPGVSNAAGRATSLRSAGNVDRAAGAARGGLMSSLPPSSLEPASDGKGWAGLRAPVTIPVGSAPQQLEVDSRTHTLYVPNGDAGTVSVIDTETCDATVSSRCAQASPAVKVGGGPTAEVIDAFNDTIYVGNFNDNTVSVINGSTCNAEVRSGCDQTPPLIKVGSGPTAFAFDAGRHTLYVANFGDGTMSVVNTAACNAEVSSGCGDKPTTISFGSVQPNGLLLDESTSTLYVSNLALTATNPLSEPDAISLVNARTCNASVVTACKAAAVTIPVGAGLTDEATGLALDPRTRTLYVANASDNTISVVDVAHCTALDTSTCEHPSPTAQVIGGLPVDLLIDPRTRTLYEVANGDNTVSVVALDTCNAHRMEGCKVQAGLLRAGVNVQNIALDPATGTLYLSNSVPVSSINGDVSVADASTCNAIVHSSCPGLPPAAAVGNAPVAIGIDPLTHTAYVANIADNTISVIDTATCNSRSTQGCATIPPTIKVGNAPTAIAVDPVTDTVYVVDSGNGTTAGDVSVVDGATCNALTRRECTQVPRTIRVGPSPQSIALDPSTDSAYVTNFGDDTLSVFDTAKCNATVGTGCGQTPVTVPSASSPADIVIDSSDHTAYVTDYGAGTVSLLDTAKCNAVVTRGCAATPTAVTVGDKPLALALDPSTDTLFVSELAGRAVSMLDAATCNVVVVSGCHRAATLAAVGADPDALALDPLTHTLYVADDLDNAVSEIDTATCNHTAVTCARQEAPSVPVGNGPQAIAVDAPDHTIYVANGLQPGLDNDVSILPEQ
jgi:DNA-binding beta-propeller fold protein YncE